MSPAVKDPNRVNIFVNDKFDFSLNLAQVVDFKLKVGLKISETDLEKFRKASEFGKLYQRTLEWVLMRPRSVFETRKHLRDKLQKRKIENRRIVENRQKQADAKYFSNFSTKKRKNVVDVENGFFSNQPNFRRDRTKELPLFTDEDIENIISRLIEKNYLDDEHFARYYLENRNSTKGTSVKKLRLELRQKGIDQNIIDQLLRENLRSDEEEIKKIIAKKAKKYNRDQLISYLVRHGFDYSLAQTAVDETD